MLERLRFQEIKKAIFRVKDDIVLNGKGYKKDQPFLIIDNAVMSKFIVHSDTKEANGRGFEGGTDTIKGVTFDLVEGHMLLSLFGAVFGTTQEKVVASRTEMIIATLKKDSEIKLPVIPIANSLLIYKQKTNGTSILLDASQYELLDDTITLIEEFTGELLVTYKENIESRTKTDIYQIGQNIVLSLEMQCEALDIITGDKFEVLINFSSVNVTTDLKLTFNTSGSTSYSMVHVEALPEKATVGINKPLFNITIL